MRVRAASLEKGYTKLMEKLDYWFGIGAIGSAVLGGYLVICDLFQTPSIFENIRPELVLVTPLALWVVCRRVFHWTDPHH